MSKLVSTYIDKLPECVNPTDGRIHCSFNQYGAKTGRFSSSDPNLQNIPSHNKDIRKMFKASDEEYQIEFTDDNFIVSVYDEIKTVNGWVGALDIKPGDFLYCKVDEKEITTEVRSIIRNKNTLIFII